MSAIFILKKEPLKKKQFFFIFLKDYFFLMGGPIDINVDVFWETSVGFLKSVLFKVMSIWMSKVAKNSTVFKKWMSCCTVFHLNVSNL